jgi:hypothetical protein
VKCDFSKIVDGARIFCRATADKVIRSGDNKHVVCLKHFYSWNHHPRAGYGLSVPKKKEE